MGSWKTVSRLQSRGMRIRSESDSDHNLCVRIGSDLIASMSDRIFSRILFKDFSDFVQVSPGLNWTRLWRTD